MLKCQLPHFHQSPVPDDEDLGGVPGSSLAFLVHSSKECVIMLQNGGGAGSCDLALNPSEASVVVGAFPGKCGAHTGAGADALCCTLYLRVRRI